MPDAAEWWCFSETIGELLRRRGLVDLHILSLNFPTLAVLTLKLRVASAATYVSVCIFRRKPLAHNKVNKESTSQYRPS